MEFIVLTGLAFLKLRLRLLLDVFGGRCKRVMRSDGWSVPRELRSATELPK